MIKYTPYEQSVLHEIERWQTAPEGKLTKAMDLVGRPFEWMFERVIGEPARSQIYSMVLRFVDLLKDASSWTFSDTDIVREAAKYNLHVRTYQELADCDLEKLDQLARNYFQSNKLIAALEGGGCGLGGLALVAADIPLLFTVCFRGIQQIGTCYGFDCSDPEMMPVILTVFHTGSSVSNVAKSAALTDIHLLAKSQLKSIPQDIAHNIAKRKLAQTIPLIGAAIGAGFNYWFMNNTLNSAYMIFRDLYLKRKYETGAAQPQAEDKNDIAKPVKKKSKPKKDKPVKPKTDEQAGAIRCKARTKSGAQCKRQTHHPSGLCAVHQ